MIGPGLYGLPSDLIHRMRTPLNHIIGYSEMLIGDAQDAQSSQMEQDLQKIRSAGRQLASLIDDNLKPLDEVNDEPSLMAQLEEELPSPTTAEFQTELSLYPVSPPLLLVIDDVESNRDVLSRRLEREGYSVITAVSGQDALDELQHDSVDLILLDIMMPEMDGYEVLRRLKADPSLQHIPVIMISALGDLNSVVRCIEMGAEDYLTKPFNPTLLRARVSSCLHRKHAHDREVALHEKLEINFARLTEVEKMRDDLTHMIIHDLRTPLTSVITGMQTVALLGDLNEDQKSIMGISIDGGNTLLGMVNDLLDVDKLESGSMQLDYDLASPADLVAAAVAQVSSLAQEKEILLIQESSRLVESLLCDPSKLLRVLVNLLGNALKFTPTGGTVTVALQVAESGRFVRFSVADTGEGIPAEAFGRIFEKFGQVASRKEGRTMSTGLGLTFCKLVVEAHGGRIWVSSEPFNGSVFSFEIPLDEPKSAIPIGN